MIGLSSGLTNTYQTISTTSTANPIAANSPVLWLKANTGIVVNEGTNSVNAWTDQSGNGNNARQATSGREPQYVSGALEFNVSSDQDHRLDLTSDIDLNMFTLVAVLDIASVESMGLLGSTSAEALRIHQGADPDRVSLLLDPTGTGTEDADQLNLTQDIPTDKFVFTFKRGSGTTDNIIVRFNGTDVTDTNGARNDSDPANAFTVADIGTAAGNFLNYRGSIAELVIFDAPLTDAKMGQVEDDMKLRCGLL